MNRAAVFSKFPTITLGDVVLREIDPENDAEYYYNYLSDPQANKFLSDDDIPKTIAEAKIELQYWSSLFNMKRSIYWGIARKNNKLIGTCGFNSWSPTHGRAEVSYDLSRKEWNKGIMTSVVRAICDYMFVNLGVQRIQATVADDNAASMAVLSKIGFFKEGALRRYGVLHSQVKDFYMYSLLSTDLSF